MITTLDGAIAGNRPPVVLVKALTGTLVAGRPMSLWALAGAPGAGGYDNTLNGVALVAPVNGQIPRTNPVSGNAHVSRFQSVSSAQAGVLMLCDRLWHNGGFTITSTAAQAIASPAWPARDSDGSSDGRGVMLALEVSAAAGAAAPTITINYTNSAGVAGRVATNVTPTANSPGAGHTFLIGLQAGDDGVRSVQSLTLSVSWVSGAIRLVAYRLVSMIELPGAGFPGAVDPITGGLSLIYDGSVLYQMLLPSTTSSTLLTGHIIETHG